MKKVFILLFIVKNLSGFAQQPKLMLPIGHTWDINSIVYSPDSKNFVTASADKTAKIWDALSGKLVLDLKGHSGEVWTAMYSPDGKKIITTSRDSTIKIWNVENGKIEKTLNGYKHYYKSAMFSPDGKKILIVPEDSAKIITPDSLNPWKWVDTSTIHRQAEVWDLTGRKIMAIPTSRYGEINAATYSPDGKFIVTSTGDGIARIWNAYDGKLIRQLIGHKEEVYSAQYSLSGKYIVTISRDTTVIIWNANTGIITAQLKSYKPFSSAKLSPDEKSLFLSTWDSTATLWEVNEGKLVRKLKNFNEPIHHATYNLDGKYLAATHANAIKIWNIPQVKTITKTHNTIGTYGISFSPSEKYIITTSTDMSSYEWRIYGNIWDKETGKNIRQFNMGSLGGGLPINIISPDDQFILAVDSNMLNVLEIKNNKVIHSVKAHRAKINSYFFSRDGKFILTASDDSTVKIWDAENLVLIYEFNYKHPVDNANFLDDFNTLIRVSGKGFVPNKGDNIIILDWKKNKKVFGINTAIIISNGLFLGNQTPFFSSQGKYMVNVMYPGEMWDITRGIKLYSDSAISSANNVFSSDENYFLSTRHSSLELRESITGKVVKTLIASWTGSYFSKDGKYLFISLLNGNIQLWQIEDWKLLHEFVGHTSSVNGMSLGTNGKDLISASSDHTCKLWNAQTGELRYTFFPIDTADYLIVDKDNRYDGTQTARKLLYFTCGTEIIELDQVKDQLWVPGLAERINKGEEINAKKLSELNICGLTPKIEDHGNNSNEYRFKIIPRRGGLGETVVSVNGIEAKRYQLLQLKKIASYYELNIKKSELKDFFIAGKENLVTVKSYTSDNAISSRGIIIKEEQAKTFASQPNLYAVMVGVSDYKGDELDLKYAAKDATDLSDAVSNAAKKLLNTDGNEHVFMYNLTTAVERYQLPEKQAVKKLLSEIGKKATANDIILVFFAGHGVMDGGSSGKADKKKQFYFLTADASKASLADAIADVAISTAELTEWIKPQNIKAQKRILIFDACNSGQAINDFIKMGTGNQNYVAARNDDKAQQIKAIDKLNEKSGLFILSASASDQNAYEFSRYSQGLLTYALLKAIKQQPDILEDSKFLNVSRWFNAAEKTVSELSKENRARQEPQIVANTNFNIGVVDDEVMAKIELSNEKPLFSSSIFLNADASVSDDNLELTRLTNIQLSDMASRGTANEIIYMNGTNSPDAYSLSGLYTVDKNTITVTVNIKHKKAIKDKFELKGTIDKLNELAKEIAVKAASLVK